MAEHDGIRDRIPDRDIKLFQVLRARIETFPSQDFELRQAIYEEARAAIERRIARHRVGYTSADAAADRLAVENAVVLAERHFGALSGDRRSSEPSAADGRDESSVPPHHVGSVAGVLIAGAIASVLLTTPRLPSGSRLEGEPLSDGGSRLDSEESARNQYPRGDDGSVAAPRPGATVPATGNGKGPPEQPRHDDVGPRAGPAFSAFEPASRSDPKAARLDRSKSDRIAASDGWIDRPESPLPSPPSTARAESKPGHVDDSELARRFDRRYIGDAPPLARVSPAPRPAVEPPVLRPAPKAPAPAPPTRAADAAPIDSHVSEIEALKDVDRESVGSIDQRPEPRHWTPVGPGWSDSMRGGSGPFVPPTNPTVNAGAPNGQRSGAGGANAARPVPLPDFAKTIVVTSNGTKVDSVAWQTTVQQFPGKAAPQTIVQASIWLDRRRTATLFLRRNEDSIVPASHIIELVFEPDATVDGSKVVSIGPASLREWPDAEGEELVAFPFQIASGRFIMTLSPNADSAKGNLALLLARPWISIPLNLANGNIRVLVLQKGRTGDEIFRTVLSAPTNVAGPGRTVN